MKRKNKLYKLSIGMEMITDDQRVAIVDHHYYDDRVRVRYVKPDWPFPEWDTKMRDQLTRVPIVYEDALL